MVSKVNVVSSNQADIIALRLLQAAFCIPHARHHSLQVRLAQIKLFPVDARTVYTIRSSSTDRSRQNFRIAYIAASAVGT